MECASCGIKIDKFPKSFSDERIRNLKEQYRTGKEFYCFKCSIAQGVRRSVSVLNVIDEFERKVDSGYGIRKSIDTAMYSLNKISGGRAV